LEQFPFYSLVGVPGAGEAPEGVLNYCLQNVPPFDVIPPVIDGTDFNGDGSTGTGVGGSRVEACQDWASLAAAQLMIFVDHHGAPVTPGKFPRYIPHQRQGWPNTVVTKYTASSQNEGHGISQLFESSAKFLDGSEGTAPVTWFSMSNENAAGCIGDWCEWLYDPVSHTLCRRNSAHAGVKTITINSAGQCVDGTTGDITGGVVNVVTAKVIDAIGALPGGPHAGNVTVVHTLNKFEKSPVVIYQRLGQFVEMDTDAARPNASFDPGTTSVAGMFTHNEGPGDIEQSGQAIWYEHWGLSGPNFQAEEAEDPYTWAICGTSGGPNTVTTGGVKDCAEENGGLDSPTEGATSGRRVVWAIVKPPGTSGGNLGGLDPLQRYGFDLRPSTGDLCSSVGSGDPSFCGSTKVMVACTNDTGGLDDNIGTARNEDNIIFSTCASEPGGDEIFGTLDDGTIYYAEATEANLRAFTRENRAFAFSFINGIGVNHPELCGELQGVDLDGDGSADDGLANACADSPSTGTRQVMFQNIQDLGATLSCFNCSALGQHTVPSHGFDRYNFKWTPLPGVHIPEDHPNSNGSIPESGGSTDQNF
jgi:hypothetical protein